VVTKHDDFPITFSIRFYNSLYYRTSRETLDMYKYGRRDYDIGNRPTRLRDFAIAVTEYHLFPTSARYIPEH